MMVAQTPLESGTGQYQLAPFYVVWIFAFRARCALRFFHVVFFSILLRPGASGDGKFGGWANEKIRIHGWLKSLTQQTKTLCFLTSRPLRKARLGRG